MPTNYSQQVKKILDIAVEQGASDIVISVNHYPAIRVEGVLRELSKEKKITRQDAQDFAFAMINETQKKRLLAQREIDFSYNFEGKVRLRVNIFFQQDSLSLAMRLISNDIKSVEQLSLPPILHELIEKTQGLVLVTGASGQGKSTTLASLINEINQSKAVHVITVEDPIEYVYKPAKSIIEQREVGIDVLSFQSALTSALRQNPDVIMVGEMRDLETIATAITAAETGHLVFATLHTNSAAQSIHRIIDVFPPEQQNQIRFQLAGSLLAVVSQRLIPKIHGGFVPSCEVMLCNTAVSNLIRENKTHEIPVVIETSLRDGMISQNRSLADLVARGDITAERAIASSQNPLELKNLLR